MKASEAHYDAKLFPHVHPYGTGSVYSEPGAGGIQHHARNRLTNIQSWFRRSSTWGFWFLTRLIQSELFFKNARRRELGRKTASPADEKDAVTRLFGTAMPADIPESTGCPCVPVVAWGSHGAVYLIAYPMSIDSACHCVVAYCSKKNPQVGGSARQRTSSQHRMTLRLLTDFGKSHLRFLCGAHSALCHAHRPVVLLVVNSGC